MALAFVLAGGAGVARVAAAPMSPAVGNGWRGGRGSDNGAFGNRGTRLEKAGDRGSAARGCEEGLEALNLEVEVGVVAGRCAGRCAGMMCTPVVTGGARGFGEAAVFVPFFEVRFEAIEGLVGGIQGAEFAAGLVEETGLFDDVVAYADNLGCRGRIQTGGSEFDADAELFKEVFDWCRRIPGRIHS